MITRLHYCILNLYASVLALASVVHLFLFPLTPSLDYFKLASNSCVSSNASVELFSKRGWDEPAIDLKIRFPGDLHGSVAYKGALWKDEIGRWLAGCDSVTKEINVSEIIGGNECKNDCSGLGVCNQELGQCRCFHGYAGFASESLIHAKENSILPDIPATVTAVKNPSSKIVYDEYNHERFPPGDPSKRAFAYFVLTGGRFAYASVIRLLVLKLVLGMSASKDVLAMASLEVDLSSIEPGTTVTVKWRGKPVFIRRRTDEDVQLANSVDVGSLPTFILLTSGDHIYYFSQWLI
ncbi:cytochrome b-c1 complex subunit Rieske-2, mitochondrial-like isoform X2 [Vicia villosa]|uniref:cytochrome b-c1 complex subunit Rieske-2, mitochondrial-like isoform X2 n=1 Tax=Vicia villosa TaxID=3911 RepID=UPI00273B376E|nr:cytochrome b-c1 complex subunit Rieske-2, mitochondrial-like isoform X2 [Vicia villosa]